LFQGSRLAAGRIASARSRAIRMRRSIVEPIRRMSACGPTRRGVHIASDRPVPN
jgi:hypothetical protein